MNLWISGLLTHFSTSNGEGRNFLHLSRWDLGPT